MNEVNQKLIELVNNEKDGSVDKMKVIGMCEKNRKEYEYKPSEFLKCKLK
jgi:hypothetical protein